MKTSHFPIPISWEVLGGNGSGWTVAALYSVTSGVPYSFPYTDSLGYFERFAGGITVLGDILEEFDYNQYFLCGSDSRYASRNSYFEQHGNHKVFDLFTAREKGYISDDYYVWWGFEDKYLYQIAKDELSRISQDDKPFNYTMLTVDTHPSGGYICDLCSNEYKSAAEIAVSCADKQIADFISWCKEQPFYDDTLIVIVGDHPRMDKYLVEGVEEKDRTMYNCFINASKQETLINKNRTFTAMDMFPSILSAMGFQYDGNRIGLGTDMFSGDSTLSEKLGFDKFSSELDKRSSYYIKNFS